MMRWQPVLLLLSLSFLAAPAGAEVELVLKNGTVMPGADVERRGSTYLVRLESGQTVEVPVKLVESLRLSGSGTPPAEDREEASTRRQAPGPRADIRVDEPSTVAGQEVEPPETAAGVQGGAPGTVAGQEVEGPPAPAYPGREEGGAPRAGVVEGSPRVLSDPGRSGSWPPSGVWVPRSDWPRSDWPRTDDDERRPGWNGAASPTWTPESSLDEDQSGFNPSQWIQAPDATWTPKDGFRKENTSLSSGAGRARGRGKVVPTAGRVGAPVPGADGTEAPGSGRDRPEMGVASWYGAEHQGHTTASGRPFDMAEYTAASPDLPFGSLVLVTNLDNGRNILVEITDRLGGQSGRTINLSRAAAERLGMLDRGLAPVRMEIVPVFVPETGTPPEPGAGTESGAGSSPPAAGPGTEPGAGSSPPASP